MISTGRTTTAHVESNGILNGIVDVFRRRLPRSEPSIYLIGSHAYGHPSPTSDIDLVVVVRRAAEEPSTRELVEWCCRVSPVPLDASVMTLSDLLGRYCAQTPFLLNASSLLYGPDLREQLPMPSFRIYTESTILLARHCVGLLRGGDWLAHVDRHPDPEDEFYGYVSWGTSAPPWRPAVPNTKLLVATAARLLYAALAVEAGVYALTRSQSQDAIRKHLSSQHQRLAADTQESCRLRWHYLVPREAAARAELRAICARFFDSERQVLASCAEWERSLTRPVPKVTE
jgi:hypothetical protein